jgi:PKD repeat protein
MYCFPSKKLSDFVVFLFMLFSVFTGSVFAQSDNSSPGGLARGQAAINKLSNRLSAVAQKYGKSPNELRLLFLEDPTLHIDDANNLLYVDDATEQTQFIDSVTAGTSAAAPFPYAQTFQLHSRPGSNRVIYLDFDGYVTSGTQWNASYTGGQTIHSAPFNIDGNSGSFSVQEMDAIQYIWQRVAEDYAPFDVDVTTEDPGSDAIFRSGATDATYGTRVVISPTNFTGSSIGGIAYVGVFNRTGTSFKPAFVMTSGLGNNEKSIAEATSHEVGHNLGLSHDGKISGGTTTAYYSGHGDWAPIMGVGYYKSVTQWSRGEYPGANQLQDDLVVMQNYGIPLISDDHGNSRDAATVLSGANISASGIIAASSDVDVFQFSTGDGNITINLNPSPLGANLNIQAKISDAQGNVLTTVNPAGLPLSVNQFLSAGVYFLTVDGVGEGSVSSGYSDYASIGQYSITGTLPGGGTTAQPPVAAVTANPTSGTTPLTIAFSSVNSTDPDGTITSYSWNFGDATSSTDPNPVHVYNSAGTFTAVLTVTDNSGMIDTDSIVITATAPQQPSNQSPVAVAGADKTSGNAPLTVNFSSAGSNDLDGTIAGYSWNFGDGTSSNQANPLHIYNNAGSYTATLTVTDNNGATASSSLVITAVQPAANTLIFVKDISLSLASSVRGTSARAVITVYDSNGSPRPNVSVTGNWSGLTGGSFTGTTNFSGQLIVNSAATNNRGTFTIKVTGLSASGSTYTPALNVKSSASIIY